MADPGFPDRVESLDGAGGQPEDDDVGCRRVRHRLPAGAPGFGALDELALALGAAVDLNDQALERLARQRRVALGDELGQPGCADSLSGRLRRHAVLDGGHAVRARGAPAEGLREPGHAGDLRVVLGTDDQARSEPVGQQDAGPCPWHERAGRRDLGKAGVAQHLRPDDVELVAALITFNKQLDVAALLPARQRLLLGLATYRLGPGQRDEVGLAEEDALVDPLEHGTGALAQAAPERCLDAS